MNSYDTIVIGAGAAGLSAALVLGRARRRILVLDGGPPRNAPAAHVNGYLGIDGLSPLELLDVGRTQVEKLGIEIRAEAATLVETVDDGFVVDAGDERLHAKRLVLAAGITDALPDIPGVAEGFGVDIFHCPYCHGYEVAGQRLAVVATQPMSAHQVRMVRQWTDDLVFFTNDTIELDAAERRLFAARGVDVVDGPVSQIVRRDGALQGVRAGGAMHEVAAVFVAPTMVLNLEAFAGLDLGMTDTPMGPVVATDPMGATNVPGLWAAGNVADAGSQVIAAAAQGARVGAMINGSLVEEDWAAAAQPSS
ncbi:NAD(P)/FAD-dependent oxidoreductase [Aeromicrobium ginsengisoli]|uniref:NAD(P)/FAD-dependent oxidoreductase n=1 Tax=Aeromicrobium ginsengisoli TaxID=363867 RepID=A0A5M4FBG2_9ACTN|nr:NAD(P)/FAD-dependent oxidoreductase [Aeromicrobium ginsengisoli]KAA1395599.1 NAD(P)/FAD-dependent oxidoreductase [Aeromicrobium ginsengisoli]